MHLNPQLQLNYSWRCAARRSNRKGKAAARYSAIISRRASKQECRAARYLSISIIAASQIRENRSSIRRSISAGRKLPPRLYFPSILRSRFVFRIVFNCSSASAERLPCLHALRLPFDAPGELPPCIRQRRLPLTAGDRHSVPDRVLAPQRGALARFAGCMGLSVEHSNFLVPAPAYGYQGVVKLNFPTILQNGPSQA